MRSARHLLIALLLVALPAAFMYPTLLLGRPLARDDAPVMVYPLFRALDAALARGDLYVWDYAQWCGLPALAKGESTGLYPLTLLLCGLLPWMTALHASYWLHLALATAGCFWVARNLGAVSGAALIAAAAYGFSGYQAAHLVHFAHITAFAHLPLMLAVLQTALRRGNWRWWALLGVELALAMVCSHPMLLVMALTVCLLWLLTGHDWRDGPRPLRQVMGLGLAAGAALLLVMPHLLPMLELAAAQGKVAPQGPAALGYLASYPFAARDLARLLLPNLYGTVHENILGGGPAWHESQPFTGAAPLLLGIAGAVVAFGTRGWRFALATAVVGAALIPSEGNPLHLLLVRLPFWGGFRATGRWIVLPILSLSLLSGLAVTGLPQASERVRGAVTKLTGLLGIVIVFAVAALWVTFGVDESGVLVLPGTLPRPVEVRVASDAVFNCVTSVEPLLLVAATIVTAVLVARFGAGRRARWPAIGLLLLAVAAPQWHLWQVTNLTVPRAYYLQPPPTAEAARRGRITVLPPGVVVTDWHPPGDTWPERAMASRALLPPALGTIYGLDYAEGYAAGLATPATLSLWESYYHYGAQAFAGLTDTSAETLELFGTPAERMKRLHALAAVQHIVTPGRIRDPDLELTLDGPVRVYSYRQRRSRWWLARRPITVAAPEAQLLAIKLREFDPDEEVVIDRAVALGADDPGLETGTVEPAPGAAGRLCVRCPAPRVLVLADAWYPGWRASLDGRPVPLLRANFAFRGVVVPAGAHTVEFDFRPTSWPLALPLCAVGLVLVIGMALWPSRREALSP
ncbi:MAG: hypothetical protein AB7Y46_18945 [Armatimonadota bacterium]